MERSCDVCGTSYEARRSTSRYCSTRCRTRASRARVGTPAAVVSLPGARSGPAPAEPATPTMAAGVEAATLAELEEAGTADTSLGRTCLALARRLDAPKGDTGSAMAAVAKQLESMLRVATKGAGGRSAPGQLEDELAARRARQA